MSASVVYEIGSTIAEVTDTSNPC